MRRWHRTTICLFLIISTSESLNAQAKANSFIDRKRNVYPTLYFKTGFHLISEIAGIEFDYDFVDTFRLGVQYGIGFSGASLGANFDILLPTFGPPKIRACCASFFRVGIAKFESFSFKKEERQWLREYEIYNRLAFILGADIREKQHSIMLFLGFISSPLQKRKNRPNVGVFDFARNTFQFLIGAGIGISDRYYSHPRVLGYDTE